VHAPGTQPGRPNGEALTATGARGPNNETAPTFVRDCGNVGLSVVWSPVDQFVQLLNLLGERLELFRVARRFRRRSSRSASIGLPSSIVSITAATGVPSLYRTTDACWLEGSSPGWPSPSPSSVRLMLARTCTPS
jgi:hypothetical protein